MHLLNKQIQNNTAIYNIYPMTSRTEIIFQIMRNALVSFNLFSLPTSFKKQSIKKALYSKNGKPI